MHRFDVSSREFKNDPFPVIQEMQQHGELVRNKIPILGPCYLTTTHGATTDLLKGADKFALEAKNAGRETLTWWWRFLPKGVQRMSKNMLTSDDPDHKRLRGLVDKAFHRQNLSELETGIQQLCDGFLDQLEKAGKSGTVDFVDLVARPLPLAVICEMLGIPEQDRGLLTGIFEGMLKSNKTIDLLKLIPKFKQMTAWFEDLFEEVREKPREGLISALVHAEENGDQLNEDELLTMVYLLFVAGHETTVHLISGGLWALSRFPEEKQKLLTDPALIETGVDEFLRYISPVMFTKPRYAKQDLEFHGTQLKRGDRVLGFLTAANYDTAVFENPEKLLLSRKPNPHTSFGGGMHFCLGFQLARMEGRILFTSLLSRFPDIQLAVDPMEVAWYQRFGLRGMSELPVTI